MKKIITDNEKGAIQDEKGENIMKPKEVGRFRALCQALVDPNKYSMTQIEKDQLDLLDKLLLLPIGKIFPILDLYRQVLLHHDSAPHFNVAHAGRKRLNIILDILNSDKALEKESKHAVKFAI